MFSETSEVWPAFIITPAPGPSVYDPAGLFFGEPATAWSLLHPEFAVVVPQPSPVQIPTAYGVSLGADDLARLIDEMILAADSAGIIDETYDYWVLGQGAQSHEPRWSIIRDVLGWVD